MPDLENIAMNDIKFMIYWIVLVHLLPGCSTLTQEECLKGDWNAIGFTDGAKGYSIERLGEHRKACADFGVSPHLATYQAGYQEGLKAYCVPETAFELGRQVKSYNGVCPEELETAFIAQYRLGLKTAKQRVEEQIKNQQNTLNGQQSALMYLSQEAELKKMQTEIQSTHKQIERLKNEKLEIIQLIKQVGGTL